MSKRQGRRRPNAAIRCAVERLEKRVLLSGASFVPLETRQVGLASGPAADPAPPVQGTIADEIVPGGVILRTIRPPLPRGAGNADGSGGAPAPSTPPRNGVGGLDIVLKKGPTLAANPAASAAFDQAAVFFETIFSDPVTIVIDADVAALPPNVIGGTSSIQFESDYALLRSDVVGDRAADELIVDQIPSATQVSVILPSDPLRPFRFVGGTVNRANLLALDVPAAELEGPTLPRSKFDPSAFVDMDITFSTNFPFDYDRSNGISPGQLDFIGVAIHEIAHGLGFTSEVDTVDFLLANPQFGPRDVGLSPLDLFRLQPGQGQANFTGSPRVLAPGNAVTNQVTYDGGMYNPVGFGGIPGLTVGDIPMSTGRFRGDTNQASHWKDNGLTGVQIGVMDPTAAGSGQQLDWRTPDNRAMGLIGWDTDITAPAVTSTAFQFQSAPNRLRFTFSEPVQLSLGTPDLLVQRLEPGGPVTVNPSSYSYDPATNTGTFTFSGALPQGNYRATLRAAGVTDFAGNRVAADTVFEFFSLAGDINRDRRVDSNDFVTLASNFGRAGTYAQGDLNGDGSVNSPDFVTLAANFGRNVPAPAGAPAVEPAAAVAPVETAPAPAPAPVKRGAPPARRLTPVRPADKLRRRLSDR